MEREGQALKIAMELRGFALSTQRTYSAHLVRFQHFCRKPLEESGYDDVRSFLYQAISVQKVSAAYVNSAYSAIKFYYQSVLCREWNMHHVPRLKKKSFLPTVLTPLEVHQVLEATSNLKHKAILLLSTVYTAGLRVSEVAHLTLSDIDSTSMRIHVRQSKGNKDRTTLLSQRNLQLLRQYWQVYRPSHWLFPGSPASKPISTRTIQSVFKQSLQLSGSSKKVSIHGLCHCFATHLLNDGATILAIKELLGHADIQTTAQYLHLMNAQVLGLRSPLDALDGDDHEA